MSGRSFFLFDLLICNQIVFAIKQSELLSKSAFSLFSNRNQEKNERDRCIEKLVAFLKPLDDWKITPRTTQGVTQKSCKS